MHCLHALLIFYCCAVKYLVCDLHLINLVNVFYGCAHEALIFSNFPLFIHLLLYSWLWLVGGAFALAVYTILFLKLYSYKDVNRWCRERMQAKARSLSRSLSCEYTHNPLGKEKQPAFLPYWSCSLNSFLHSNQFIFFCSFMPNSYYTVILDMMYFVNGRNKILHTAATCSVMKVFRDNGLYSCYTYFLMR